MQFSIASGYEHHPWHSRCGRSVTDPPSWFSQLFMPELLASGQLDGG
jgi:hypothetical protein